MQISTLPAFNDNYLYVLHQDHRAFVIDPGDGPLVHDYLLKNNLDLEGILLTHHHYDHIGGVDFLKAQYNCKVYGHQDDEVLPELTHPLSGEETLKILGQQVKALSLPGHTKQLLAYHFIENKYLFSGDHVFSCGCGRIFNGDPVSFWNSLKKLKSLDKKTLIYFAHEYTLANIKYCRDLGFKDDILASYQVDCEARLKSGEYTTPVLLEEEILRNPFLQCDNRELQALLETEDEYECFRLLRTRKDKF